MLWTKHTVLTCEGPLEPELLGKSTWDCASKPQNVAFGSYVAATPACSRFRATSHRTSHLAV